MGLTPELAVLATALALDPIALDPTAVKTLVLALSLALAWIAALRHARPWASRNSRAPIALCTREWIVMLYPAYQSVAALFVPAPWDALSVALRNALAAQVLLLARAASLDKDRRYPDRVTPAILGPGTCLLVVLGFWSCTWGFTKPRQDAYTTAREMVGTLGNPAMLGAWMGAMIPLLLGDRRSKLAVVAVPLATAALWLSYSRAGLLAVAGAIALVGPWPRRRQWALLAAGGVLALAGTPLFPYASKLASAHTSVQRLLVWQATLRIVAAHPFRGIGPGQFARTWPEARPPDYGRSGLPSVMTHAHCVPLHELAEGGVLGLAILALALGPTFLRLSRAVRTGTRKDPTPGRARACALIVLGLHALVSPSTESPAILSLAAWLSGIVDGPGREDSANEIHTGIQPVAPVVCVALFMLAADVACAVPLVRVAQAQREAGEGERARLAQNMDGAAARFAAAAALDPEDGATRFLAGAALARSKPCEALAAMLVAEATWGDQGDVHYDRSIVSAMLALPAAARRQVHSHLDRDSASVPGLMLAGQQAYEDGDLDRARACVQKALTAVEPGSRFEREIRRTQASLSSVAKKRGSDGR